MQEKNNLIIKISRDDKSKINFLSFVDIPVLFIVLKYKWKKHSFFMGTNKQTKRFSNSFVSFLFKS